MEDGWGMLKRFQILFPEIQPRPILDPPPLPFRNRGNCPFPLGDDKCTHDDLLVRNFGTSYLGMRIASFGRISVPLTPLAADWNKLHVM